MRARASAIGGREQPSAEAGTRRRRNPVAVPLPLAERTAENESEADAQPRDMCPRIDATAHRSPMLSRRIAAQSCSPPIRTRSRLQRRRSLRRSRRNENDEQYTAQDDYGEEERPRRRSRRVESEEQHDVQDDYAEEERPRRRSRRIEDEEQYDVQDDYAGRTSARQSPASLAASRTTAVYAAGRLSRGKAAQPLYGVAGILA